MREPKISLIMPTYNRVDMIGLAIESILRQHFADFELIIIDDGSTDKTAEEVLKHPDSRVRLEMLKHGDDFGIGALNYGMDLARGEYLTFITDDNLYFSYFLRTLLEGMDDSGADFAYSNFLNYDRENYTVDEFTRPAHLDGQLKIHHLAIGYTIGICFLYKRELFEKVKPYRPGPHSDYDLVARMAIEGAEFLKIDSLLGMNSLHAGQLSETSQDMQGEQEIRLMVCKHLRKIKYPGAEILYKLASGDSK